MTRDVLAPLLAGVDKVPSGALRVRVYADMDQISKRRMNLTEVVPAGPKAGQEAERIRTRMLSQLDERRSPRTRATLGQLLDKWLEVLDVCLLYTSPSPRDRS